jgi:catechol 2,3-dioxygenase-like lactoylglutathione lyase family enzyme
MDLNQVTIPSRDVKKSIAFYQKLGLNLIVHTHDAYARFECPDGDSTLSVHLVDKDINGPGVVIYFEVPDVAKRVSELQKRGIEFEEGAKEQSWLWTEAHLKDPDGNQLIIYHAGDNRKNPPWRINSEL